MTWAMAVAEDNAFTVKTLADWTTTILEQQGVDTTEIDPGRIEVLFRAAVHYVLPEEIRWNEKTGVLYYEIKEGAAAGCSNCAPKLHFSLDATSYVLLAAVTSQLWRPYLTTKMELGHWPLAENVLCLQ